MTEVGIVGAGVIGLMCALELRRAGFSVTLLERNRLAAAEASWAGGGILSPLYPWRSPAELLHLVDWSRAQYPSLIAELKRTTGIDPELRVRGMLFPEPTAADIASAEDYEPATLIDAKRCARLEPGLAMSAQAILIAGAATARNPRLGRALTKRVVQVGVDLRLNREVRTAEPTGGGWRLDTSGGPLACDRLVIAGGAWTGELLATLGANLPVRPIKGEMIAIRSAPGVVRRVVLSAGRYVIPRRDGIVLVGSTVEERGFDKSVNRRHREELLEFAAGLIPALSRYPLVGHWSGLRPALRGDIPVVGAVPNAPGLYVCSGHYRAGLAGAPASARLLRNMLAGEAPILSPKAYAPGGSN